MRRGEDPLPRALCKDLPAEVAFKLETEAGAEACGDQAMSILGRETVSAQA